MEFLEGTVLEIGEYVAVPYAGKLFSDLGADVIKLEPQRGDVARRVDPFADDRPDLDGSEFFGYLNTGKRSVTVPSSDALATDFVNDLIESYDVDVVIENRLSEYGIDPEGLSRAHDELSVVSLSGFGATGPWQEYEAPDFVAWAESGHMNKMGYPEGPPVRPRMKAADYWAGQVTAFSAMAALLARSLQGRDGQYVDVSKREAGISTMDRFIAGYSWTGETSERSGDGYPKHDGQPASKTIYETADGHISLRAKWDVFCTEFLDRPELVDDERFSTRAARKENMEEVTDIIEGYTSNHGKWDLFERFQEAGIAAGITATPADVFAFEHLHEREFWQEVPLPSGETVTMPGFPFRPGGPDSPVSMDRAPRLGEHTGEVCNDLGYDPSVLLEPDEDASRRTTAGSRSAETDANASAADPEGPRPLEGIKVLDLSWVYAGPHTTKFLSALGADVAKVESKQKPDSSRNSASYHLDTEPTASVSASYNERNQGKRAMRLDLTTEGGRELALELIREADLVIENYSPGFMDRIDLGYERLREANPEVVYLSMPGIAGSGPAKNYRAYGMTIQSMIGLDDLSGFPDDPPTTPGHSWPDPTAGYMGTVAALMGLQHREREGEGTFIELPQFEIAASLLHKPLMEYANNGRTAERTGDRDEDHRFVQGVYPCRGEDRWAVVAIETTEQWQRLCELVGKADLATDERFDSHYARLEHHDAVDEVIEEWTSTRTREEVRHRLQAEGIPAGIVADEEDLVERDPQLRAREYFTTQETPEVGEHQFQGVPFEMADADVEFPSPAPLFGEHTEEILEDWLGYTESEIRKREDQGALY